MYIILLCTILGFLAGLSYTLIKRRVSLGPIVTGTLLGALITGIWKAAQYSKNRKKKRFY